MGARATCLGASRAVAHMAGPVQYDLPVQNTHVISEQGRL